MTELTRTEVANLIANILDRGISLDDLVEASGVSAATIIMIMRGQLRPSEHVRIRLAGALGIDTKVLL